MPAIEHPADPIPTLRRLLDGLEVAMLTVVDASGDLQSRPMTVQLLDDEGCLWFLASRSSHQVERERAEPRVNLAFADPGRNRYVSVTGRVVILDDRERRHALWSPAAKVWFRGGADDPDLVVLRVLPAYVDYWEGPSNAVSRLAGFAAALVTGDDGAIGRQGHFELHPR